LFWPPIGERPEDLLLLVRAIVDEVGRKMGKRIEAIDEDSLAGLRRYHWPGNVRELRNVVERAIILGSEGLLWIEPPERRSTATTGGLTLEDMERHHRADPRSNRLARAGDRGRGEGARVAPVDPRDAHGEARDPAPVLNPGIPGGARHPGAPQCARGRSLGRVRGKNPAPAGASPAVALAPAAPT
jgi:hypothetical protein